MPCACRAPVPDYPENAEWGPILWKILHGLAERARGDEFREWSKMIKLTGEMLPCDECRSHYSQFLKQRPLTQTPELKTTLRTWFWDLHNEVNLRTGKPEYPFDFSQYSKIDLQDLLWQLDPVMKKAIQINGVGLLKYIHWINSVKMLRSLLF